VARQRGKERQGGSNKVTKQHDEMMREQRVKQRGKQDDKATKQVRCEGKK
jgi:hypothetical protein